MGEQGYSIRNKKKKLLEMGLNIKRIQNDAKIKMSNDYFEYKNKKRKN